jgi:acetoin utilization deacetylase AcuC-like enzyme
LRQSKIKTFYTPEQVCRKHIESGSFSKSPLKPMLLMAHLHENGFGSVLELCSDFQPFSREDFLKAHTQSYVNDFFAGTGQCSSNGLPWSKELVSSVCFTNSSLFHAIQYACENPSVITFSPTSGFHHAMPNRGSGFCTFSGQVIASLKLYEAKGLVGAYLDLDGHFGNSISDSISFAPQVEKAIAMNINPKYRHKAYLEDFEYELEKLVALIKGGKVDYVVWCHGADSHEWDDLGNQCTTAEWIACAKIFYTRMKALDMELGRPVPITLSLFGGYRSDDYESVLSLHATDLKTAAQIMLAQNLSYKTRVNPK